MLSAWPISVVRRLSRVRWDVTSRCVSMSASMLSPATPLKVGVLPFVERDKDALEAMGARVYRNLIWQQQTPPSDFQKRLQGVDAEEKTQVKSIRLVYIPYWEIDAKAVIRVFNATSSARMYIFLDNFLIPAHRNTELQLLSLDIPASNKVQYQALDKVIHLGTKLSGHKSTISPFLFTPTTIASVERLFSKVFQSIPLSVTESKAEEVRIGLMKKLEMPAEEIKGDNIMQLDLSLFSIEYLSSRPILMPLYLVEFTNSSTYISEKKRQMTLACPGWKTSDPTINYHFESQKSPGQIRHCQRWIGSKDQVNANLRVFFLTRIPFASRIDAVRDRMNFLAKVCEEKSVSLFEEGKKETQIIGKLRKWWDTILVKMVQYMLRGIKNMTIKDLEEEERGRDDAAEIKHVEDAVRNRFQAFIEEALEMDLAKLQASKHSRNYKLPTFAENKAGLGASIDWDDPLITAPSGCNDQSQFQDHRAFFEQDIKVQVVRSEVFQRRRQERHRQEKSNDEADMAIITEELKKRAILRPFEVRSMQNSLPLELHKRAEEMRAGQTGVDNIIDAVEPKVKQYKVKPEIKSEVKPTEKPQEKVVKLERPKEETDKIKENSERLRAELVRQNEKRKEAELEKEREVQRLKQMKDEETRQQREKEAAMEKHQKELNDEIERRRNERREELKLEELKRSEFQKSMMEIVESQRSEDFTQQEVKDLVRKDRAKFNRKKNVKKLNSLNAEDQKLAMEKEKEARDKLRADNLEKDKRELEIRQRQQKWAEKPALKKKNKTLPSNFFKKNR